MPLWVNQPPRDYQAGEPVFSLAKDGWFIGSAIVTEATASTADYVRIGYIVPDPQALAAANEGFAGLLQSLYGRSGVGIEESVPIGTLVPMHAFVGPASAAAGFSIGTTIVTMRREPYRVQLAELLEPFAGGIAIARMVIPEGEQLTVAGAQTELPRENFLTVEEYELAIRRTYDPVRDIAKWTYFGVATS